MRFQITPQSPTLAKRIAEMTFEAMSFDHEGKTHDSLLEQSVVELVKLHLRALAQDEVRDFEGDDLLEHAIGVSKHEVDRILDDAVPIWHLEPYWKCAADSLHPPTRELDKLRRKLRDTKAAGRKARWQIEQAPDAFDAKYLELGLKGSTEGLLVIPPTREFFLDLDRLPERARLIGEFFPFEIEYEGHVFIVDDDGSIFVSVANFPGELEHQASQLLAELGDSVWDLA